MKCDDARSRNIRFPGSEAARIAAHDYCREQPNHPAIRISPEKPGHGSCPARMDILSFQTYDWSATIQLD